MTTENERPLQYFAATSDFDWGRGPTLDAALDNARFHLKQDWVNIYIGYDLEPGCAGAATGEIVSCIKLNLARYRRTRREAINKQKQFFLERNSTMKLENIKIGTCYDIKVGKNTSAVRILKPIASGGFEAVTLATNKTLVIKSADRVVGLHNPKADKHPKTAKTPATVDPATSATKRLSALDAAAKVLAEAKEPLNCKQMIDAMTAKGYWQPSQGGKTPANTLHAAIGTEIKKKGDAARFEKVGRGQFGLHSS